MLKIVNQTTMLLGYEVVCWTPTSQQIGKGALEPNKIVAYRIDNDPPNNTGALNCTVRTYNKDPSATGAVFLEFVNVPGNATVVFSTQIITGLLQPGS